MSNEKWLERIERRMTQEYSRLDPPAFGDMLDLVAEVRRQEEEIKELQAFKDAMRRTALLLLLAEALGCSPSTPGEPPPARVLPFWSSAQELLAERYGRPEARAVGPDYVRAWVEHPGPFSCGKYPEVNGCFLTRSRVIEWNKKTLRVLCHESAHAILHALKDKRASKAGHKGSIPTDCRDDGSWR